MALKISLQSTSLSHRIRQAPIPGMQTILYRFTARTIASMEKLDELLHAEGAIMSVNHDTAQNSGLPHAPQSIV